MAALVKLGPLVATWALLGCTGGVALRPDGSPADEKCPEEAREAMASLHLNYPGTSAVIWVDATRKDQDPLIVYDGPVESITWVNMEDLPGKTLLYGRIWTGGPRVVIRYYSARLPGGERIPFCGVAVWEGEHGIPKSSGRPGSAAIQNSHAWVYPVGGFR